MLDILAALEKKQFLKVKLLARRRAFKAMAKEAYQAEGLVGVFRFFSAMFLGTTVNKDKLWSYKRLGLLPEGTLGREYWKHLTEVGFGFPGEPGGIHLTELAVFCDSDETGSPTIAYVAEVRLRRTPP